MYLSAERIAVANKAIQETFEQTSIAWQAIPHWDTGDPAQTKVRRDLAYAPPGDRGPLGEDPVDIVTFLFRTSATQPEPHRGQEGEAVSRDRPDHSEFVRPVKDSSR
jgi:hypothetical protein